MLELLREQIFLGHFLGTFTVLNSEEEQRSVLIYMHVTSLTVAQGHINRKMLEILEAGDVKCSSRRNVTSLPAILYQ